MTIIIVMYNLLIMVLAMLGMYGVFNYLAYWHRLMSSTRASLCLLVMLLMAVAVAHGAWGIFDALGMRASV